MTNYKILHVGFDGLDVSFQGALRQVDLDKLTEAKDEAQRESREVLVEIGPGRLPMHVAGTGARGGYAFRTDTGPDGETWFFKRSTEIEDWNIRVSMKSLPLATLGYAAVKKRLFARLDAMGARVLKEAVGRFDVAVDFDAPKFELSPDLFVAHWRARRNVYAPGKAQELPEADEIRVNYSGRRASSVTVGKMPNRQVIVYDKRREAIDQRKGHWFEIWGIPKDDKSLRVWRVEVRAGKNLLNDYRLKTFADLELLGADVIRESLEAVRYLDPKDQNRNVSRRADHALWHCTRAALRGVFEQGEQGVCRSKIREGTRRDFQHQYRALMAGFAASYSVALDIEAGRAEQVGRKIASDVAEFIRANPDKFLESRARAEQRLFFINEGIDNADYGSGAGGGNDHYRRAGAAIGAGAESRVCH